MAQKSSFDVLIDTGVFIAQLLPDDLFHQYALDAFKGLQEKRLQPVTTSAVIGETVTVLSHRGGQDLVRLFLTSIKQSQMPVIFVDEDMHNETLALFEKQNKKGTSYVDCTDFVVMQKLTIPYILSFDEFHKRMGLKAPNE